MRTFEARYAGGCAADCGQRIHPGDDVTYVDDDLVHADCADTFSTDHGHGTYRPTAPCPSCYMIHAGECL